MALRREKLVAEDLEIGTGTATRTADDGSTLTGNKIELDSFPNYHADALNIGAATDAVTTAILELTSTAKGFLPPRLTTTQRNAISSPATGLVVYNTSTNKLNVYTGSAWEAISSA